MPHSEICGSRPVSGFPQLFAAVHVLHRFSLPRHPPCALRSLTVPLRHASSSHTGFELRITFARSLASFRTLVIDIDLFSCQRPRRSPKTPREIFPRMGPPAFASESSCCGAGRDRTDDLRLAKPALSQLSYSPLLLKVRESLAWTGATVSSTALGGPGQS